MKILIEEKGRLESALTERKLPKITFRSGSWKLCVLKRYNRVYVRIACRVEHNVRVTHPMLTACLPRSLTAVARFLHYRKFAYLFDIYKHNLCVVLSLSCSSLIRVNRLELSASCAGLASADSWWQLLSNNNLQTTPAPMMTIKMEQDGVSVMKR